MHSFINQISFKNESVAHFTVLKTFTQKMKICILHTLQVIYCDWFTADWWGVEKG